MPEAALDDLDEQVQVMASEGVLTVGQGRVAFFHETFFDYSFARLVVAAGGTVRAQGFVTSFMLGDPPVSADGFELTAAAGGGGSTQAVEVTVSSQGEGVWSQTLQGFVAAIVRSTAGSMVLVLDQTGGIGTLSDGGIYAGPGTARPARFETRPTAYAASTGDQVWQVPLPGTPHVIAPISDEFVVVPNGTELHAVDSASGEEIWTVEMPSPGRAAFTTTLARSGSLLAVKAMLLSRSASPSSRTVIDFEDRAMIDPDTCAE